MSATLVDPVSKKVNELSFLWKPLGCSESTTRGIRNWIREEKPGFIQRSTPPVLGGIVAVVLGAILGLFTSSENNKSASWFGGLLGVGGIVACAVGFLFGPNLNVEEDRSSEPASGLQGQQTQKVGHNEIEKDLGVNKSDDVSDLGKVDDIKALIDCLNNRSNDPKVRSSAAITLGKSNDKRVVTPLINCLKRKTDDPDVRSSVAFALGLRANPKEISRIIRVMIQLLMNKKENQNVRQRMIIALSQIGDLEALSFLRGLQGSPNEELTNEISYAIEKIEERLSNS